MADSNAVRSKRSRLHRRGDHSLCREGCSTRAETGPAPGSVAAAVVEVTTSMNLGPGDPRGPLAALAAHLARRVDSGKAAMTEVTQLRLTLAELAKVAGPGAAVRPLTDADLERVLDGWEAGR